MPVLPQGIDPEGPGSRFTLRPAIAILFEPENDGLDPQALLESAGSGWLLEEHEVLGRAQPVPGGFGRGFEVGVPVVEWLVHPAVAGIVGALSWELTKLGGRKLIEILGRLRDQGRDLRGQAISRGAAGMIAAATVEEDTEVCVVEAIEEPDFLGGAAGFMEDNYVGIQPWIVVIVDRSANRRHIVVVSPEGIVRGHLVTDREPDEATYYG